MLTTMFDDQKALKLCRIGGFSLLGLLVHATMVVVPSSFQENPRTAAARLLLDTTGFMCLFWVLSGQFSKRVELSGSHFDG